MMVGVGVGVVVYEETTKAGWMLSMFEERYTECDKERREKIEVHDLLEYR